MNIIRYLVICLLTYFVFGNSITLLAQTAPHPEDALMRPSSLLMQELAAGENAALVIQQGITQAGDANQAIIVQNGNRNAYNANVDGTCLHTYVLQEGNRNTITQSLTDSENSTTELIQIGNDNEIIHEIDGAVNQSFRLIQEGDGQSVIIRQSYEN